MSWPELHRARPGRPIPLVLFVGLLAACAEAAPPFAVDRLDVRHYSPPQIYSVWWDEAAECSGGQGRLVDIEFHAVLDPALSSGEGFRCFESGRTCQGAFVRPNEIYIAAALTENEWIVKHEMLHALVGPEESPVTYACAR